MRLDRRGFRTILGLARSAEILARDRELCLVLPERDGAWRARSRAAEMFAPGPNIRPFGFIRDRVADVFCHAYTPRAGDVVLDAGAGIGREALVFSRLVGSGGAVHCVEAHPTTFALLERTRDANALENVQCYQAALGEQVGAVTIDTQQQARHYYRNRLGGTGVTVPAITVASLMADHGIERIDLLAMNIEGGETAALRGMAPVADRVRAAAIGCHDFLADETGDDDLRTKADVCELLRGYGFSVIERGDRSESAWCRDFVYGVRGKRERAARAGRAGARSGGSARAPG